MKLSKFSVLILPWPCFVGVPDYPPPSFQEATGTVMPVASSSNLALQSSSTLVPPTTSPTQSAAHHHEISECDLTIGRASPTETPSASESEESLENIPPSSTEEIVPFPCQSPSLGSLKYTDTSVSPSSDSLSRGRTKSKLASILDMTQDDSPEAEEPEPETLPPPPRSTKKRLLSLSPLRTLFPPKHQALQSRALSAHPPGTHPYSSTPRSTHFFRSTTSLASSSMLRLPFGASTLTLTANKQPDDAKSVSGKSTRRFFHSSNKEKDKGKERRQRENVDYSDESLESWEILESDEKVACRKIDTEPRSLMAMITSAPESPPSPTIGSDISSPTRSLSFTYGAPPAPTSDPALSSVVNMPHQPNLAPPQTQLAPSWNEPHPLSLRDKKVAEAIQPFLNRRPKKGHHRSKTVPSPIVVPPPTLPGAGPPVTTVRTRMNMVHDNQNEQLAVNVETVTSEPETRREEIRVEEEEKSVTVDENTYDFQRALDTPLPSSPVQSSFLSPPQASPKVVPTSASSSPSSRTINIPSPATPVPARDGTVLNEDKRGEYFSGGVQPLPAPIPKAPKVAELLDTPIPKPVEIECVCKHHSAASLSSVHSSPIFRRSPSPPNSISQIHIPQRFHTPPLSMSSFSSRVDHRQHYLGRPLPRPPQPQPQPPPSGQGSRNVVVDSIYAGHEPYSVQSSSPNTTTTVPEGLLIDLENNDDDSNMSGYWTPPLIEEHSHHLVHFPSGHLTPNQMSTPVGSRVHTPDYSVRSRVHTPDYSVRSRVHTPDHSVRSMPLSFSSANASSISGLSEMTDLDLLAAALGEPGNNGADYEVGRRFS